MTCQLGVILVVWVKPLTDVMTCLRFSYASLLVGNLAMDKQGRARVLSSPTLLDSLTRLVWDDDVKTVRHTTGALRNISSDSAGRKRVKLDKAAVGQIQYLASHSDVNTARYASAVIKNLDTKGSKTPKFTF